MGEPHETRMMPVANGEESPRKRLTRMTRRTDVQVCFISLQRRHFSRVKWDYVVELNRLESAVFIDSKSQHPITLRSVILTVQATYLFQTFFSSSG